MTLEDWLVAREGKAVKLHLTPPDGAPEMDVAGRMVRVDAALGGGTVTIANETGEYSVHVDFIHDAECDGEPYRP